VRQQRRQGREEDRVHQDEGAHEREQDPQPRVSRTYAKQDKGWPLLYATMSVRP